MIGKYMISCQGFSSNIEKRTKITSIHRILILKSKQNKMLNCDYIYYSYSQLIVMELIQVLQESFYLKYHLQIFQIDSHYQLLPIILQSKININIRDNTTKMDTNDTYTTRNLLFRQCDNSISKIYANIIKMMYDPSSASQQSLKSQTIKQIQLVTFQIFKYKTALLALQKDIHYNQQAQVLQDRQIQKSKQQIRLLTQDVKSAETVRKRKLEYNQIAKSVKQFDTNQKLNQKISNVENQLQNLENQYKLDMEAYAQKQRCLKIALSALRVLMKQQGATGNGQSPVNLI